MPRPKSVASEKRILRLRTPRRPIKRHEQMDNEEALKTSGICVLGHIDPNLIEALRKYAESAVRTTRHHRQTEIEWNGTCDAVQEYFEKHLQPSTSQLRGKKWISRRLVKYHNISESSEIYRPDKGKGTHTVTIPIRSGRGFPLIYEGSQDPNTALDPASLVNIPQAEGSVVAFDASLACQNPAVEDNGGWGILILY